MKGRKLKVLIILLVVLIIGTGFYIKSKTIENIEKSLLKIPNTPVFSTNNTNKNLQKVSNPKIIYFGDRSLPKDGSSYIYIGSLDKNRKEDSVDIKVNGSRDFYPIEHLSPFILSWNIKNAYECSLGGGEVVPDDSKLVHGSYNIDFSKVGPSGSARLKGFRADYKTVLRVVLVCYNDKGKNIDIEHINIEIGIPVIQPTFPLVEFVYPKEGDVLREKIEYGDWNLIKWKILNESKDMVISSVDFIIREASSGERIYPRENGKISSFTNKDDQSGIFSNKWHSKIPKGSYYLEIEKINNIPVNVRSGVFKVKGPTIMQQLRATLDSLLYVIGSM